MSDSTRRGFLKVAGVGVAAAGVAVAVPATAKHSAAPTTTALPAAANGAIMAYVTDVHSGQVAVMVEGREVMVTDHDLVARLATVLHSDPSSAV